MLWLAMLLGVSFRCLLGVVFCHGEDLVHASVAQRQGRIARSVAKVFLWIYTPICPLPSKRMAGTAAEKRVSDEQRSERKARFNDEGRERAD